MSFENKMLTIALSLVLAFILLCVFIVFPLGKSIKAQADELFFIRKEFKTVREKSQTLTNWETKYSELKPDFERIKSLHVDKEVPVDFLDFLEKTAHNSDLLIEISLTPKKDDEKSLNLKLVLFGSPQDCLMFIEKIELAPYLIEIGNFDLTKLSEEHLKLERYSSLSQGDIELDIYLKAITND